MKNVFASIFILSILLWSPVAQATDVPAGNVEGTWTAENSPYVITGDIRVAEGDALTIEPGTEINFSGQYILRVVGNLSAIGAEGDSITFTSNAVNTWWNGIKLDSLATESDTARFEYCRINQMKNTGINIIRTNKVVFEHTRFFDNLDMYIGAVYTALGDPVFRNCRFENNDSAPSSEGAAMYIWDASPVLQDCEFVGNQSPWSSGAIAIYRSDSATEPQFLDCLFQDNFTSGSGGAIVSHSNCVSYFENCQFINNSSLYNGGAIWDGYTLAGTSQYVNCLFEGNHCEDNGGAIYMVNTKASFDNCEFRDNYSDYQQGGAVFAYDECTTSYEQCVFSGNVAQGSGGALDNNDNSTTTINRCLFRNNSASMGGGICFTYYMDVVMTNSIIVNNEAINYGGAFRLVQFSHAVLNNCVIVNNRAGTDGAGFSLYWDSDPVLTNCIMHGNRVEEEIQNLQVQNYIWHTCEASFIHCIVEGGEDSFNTGESGLGAYTNVLTDDPLFIYPSEGSGVNFSAEVTNWNVLEDESPCINTGTPTIDGLGLGDVDYGGNDRLQDDIVDIGAYEGGELVLPPTITQDPVPASICWGDNLTLSVEYEGTEPISLQWSMLLEEIDGATSSELILEDVTAADAGQYYCIVSNVAGSVYSDTVDVFIPEEAPWVELDLTQPFCFNDPSGSINGESSEGVVSFELYELNDMETSMSESLPFSGLAAGDYVLTAIDEFGCSIDEEVQIIPFNSQIVIEIPDTTLATCSDCPDGIFVVAVSGGSPDYVYSLDGINLGSPSEITMAPGEHVFCVEDDAGCIQCQLLVMDEDDFPQEIDFNGDGIISTADLLIFLGQLGCEGCDCEADLNGDCLVNITDLLDFLTQFP